MQPASLLILLQCHDKGCRLHTTLLSLLLFVIFLPPSLLLISSIFYTCHNYYDIFANKITYVSLPLPIVSVTGVIVVGTVPPNSIL